jgi:hypothetical protein
MLELNKLTTQVSDMAQTVADQRGELGALTHLARAALDRNARVNEELRAKLKVAAEVDPSWRGADPLGDWLNASVQLSEDPPKATLLASDGSQIYPDTHGIALYYLLNVGTIVLRQGSGQAPVTATHCQVFYREEDLYDDLQRLIEADQVNAQRDLWELAALADLVSQERARSGGDLSPILVALADGPLLPWMPQRLSDAEQQRQVAEFAGELRRLRQAQAVPVGYVDRPRSANVLRLLHLAELSTDQVTKEQLRRFNPYRGLSDRALFAYLKPGQRSGLFAATSEINTSYAQAGHRIFFCYLNVAWRPGEGQARIVRVEMPEWTTRDEARLDQALAAVRADCRVTEYPYVLTRAHEVAVVTRQEREAFEQMLRVALMQRGLPADQSAKQRQKALLGGSR